MPRLTSPRPTSPRLTSLALCAVLLAPALALTACGDNDGVRITTTRSSDDAKGVLKVIDTLQCPDSLGSLTRKGSASPDGKVCTYAGPRGAEVELHLVTLGDDGVDPILKRFESGLLAVMPQTAADISRSAADSARADAQAARADAMSARAEAESARAEAEAEARANGADSAHVSAPGMRVDAEGDRASVHMPGIHVEADGDKADVRIGGLVIHANDEDASVNGQLTTGEGEKAVSFKARDDAAEIRTRAPGEAVRQTYLLTDNRASPNGWRTVGYEARGPRTGPIVVATVRSRERNADSVFDDAKDLVTLNVGE